MLAPLAPPRFAGSSTGGRADYSWPVTDLDGRPVDLGRYRGKAVFLNVWATWCGPCVAEMPSIARLAADPRLKDVAFVGISVDDDAAPVRRFLKEHGLSCTIRRASGGAGDIARPPWEQRARPGRASRRAPADARPDGARYRRSLLAPRPGSLAIRQAHGVPCDCRARSGSCACRVPWRHAPRRRSIAAACRHRSHRDRTNRPPAEFRRTADRAPRPRAQAAPPRHRAGRRRRWCARPPRRAPDAAPPSAARLSRPAVPAPRTYVFDPT